MAPSDSPLNLMDYLSFSCFPLTHDRTLTQKHWTTVADFPQPSPLTSSNPCPAETD